MTLWPLFIFFLAVLAVVGLMLGISWLLGERHQERATNEPYESGVPAAGPARRRLASSFYVVGLMFVIFDLEAVFLFAWAVAAPALGWTGFVEVTVFVAVLGAALLYLVREGALEPGGARGAGR